MQTTIQADNCGCLMMFEYPCMYICSIYNRMNGSIQDPLQANRTVQKKCFESRSQKRAEVHHQFFHSDEVRFTLVVLQLVEC